MDTTFRCSRRPFEFLKTQDEPVLLHILTKKGKGYEPAIAKPDKFHGLGKFAADTGETAAAGSPTYSELLGKTLAKFADSNKNVVAITAAMPTGTGLIFFQQQHPERYYDVGIAEEHAALFACGLATQGLKPFLTIYSTFMQRAYDMIIHDMALQNLPVALCMDRAASAATTAPRTMASSTSATCVTFRTSCTCSRRMKTSSSTCSGRWRTTAPARSRSAIRVAPAPALCRRPRRSSSRSAKPEVVQHGRDVAISASEHVRSRAGGRAKLEEHGYSVALINPRWIKAARHRHARVLRPRDAGDLHPRDHVLHNGFGAE
jgi:1-deoxy-D-xylulose-5-phosphate synthase